MGGCPACSTDHLGGGRRHPERVGRHDGGAHRGTVRARRDNASRPGGGVNPPGAEGGVCRVHTADRLNETWIYADGRAPPSH